MLAKLTRVALGRFSLDFSNLAEPITSSAVKNFTIDSNPNIDGYLTKNKDLKEKMNTVIMIHEWWGFNKSIVHTAELFSNHNIRVFVPDLFRGEAANSAEEAGHKMEGLDWPKALQDLQNIKHFFDQNSQSVSIVGFCMGGALTFAALSSIKGWKAGGVFYGVPDFNIFPLANITANVVANFGRNDPLKGFSDSYTSVKLKKECEDKKYPIDVRIYEGCSHAFCNQDSNFFNQSQRNTAFGVTKNLIEQI